MPESLKGSDLDLVEKVGWDAEHGLPVDAIPTPVATGQTLRGEAEGRRTSVV